MLLITSSLHMHLHGEGVRCMASACPKNGKQLHLPVIVKAASLQTGRMVEPTLVPKAEHMCERGVTVGLN